VDPKSKKEMRAIDHRSSHRVEQNKNKTTADHGLLLVALAYDSVKGYAIKKEKEECVAKKYVLF